MALATEFSVHRRDRVDPRPLEKAGSLSVNEQVSERILPIYHHPTGGLSVVLLPCIVAESTDGRSARLSRVALAHPLDFKGQGLRLAQ